MPAVSKKQQRFMGVELAKEEKTGHNDTGMNESQLKDFTTTKRKGLPERKISKRDIGGRR